jgi:hypothetical protein
MLQDYPLEVFRKHIHQEVRRHKFAYCKVQAKKKKQKKQPEEEE